MLEESKDEIDKILEELKALRFRLNEIRHKEYTRLEGKTVLKGVRFLLELKRLDQLIERFQAVAPEDILFGDNYLESSFLKNQRQDYPDILAGESP